MRSKCVFVVGPESSGSMLVARIVAHVLDASAFGSWNGVAWTGKGLHKICHRSMPFNIPPEWPNIDAWIRENEADHDLYFIVTTRDITISEESRVRRFPKTYEQVRHESGKARTLISSLLASEQRCFVFSYEAFMYLEMAYLKLLYRFLDVESDFIPELADANRRRLLARADPPVQR